jgi:hypothetical protein
MVKGISCEILSLEIDEGARIMGGEAYPPSLQPLVSIDKPLRAPRIMQRKALKSSKIDIGILPILEIWGLLADVGPALKIKASRLPAEARMLLAA